MRIVTGYFEGRDMFTDLPEKQIEKFDLLNSDFICTNSPYILNYLNLCIIRFDKNIDGKKIDFDTLEVSYIDPTDFTVSNLKVQNERLVNTNHSSDLINWIYDEYERIKNS
jgi:hypothetical protein